MTVVDLIQEFCRRTGLPSPSYVAGNTDGQVIQLLALLNEIGEDLAAMPYTWTALNKEATFVTLAAEDQGALTTLAPVFFRSIIEQTLFNRTTNQQFIGPVSPNNWQAMKSANSAGTQNLYRIVGGHLHMYPAPTAGQTCAFEYSSRAVFLATDGVTYKEYATADSDTTVLPAKVMLAGLRWKWRSEKGLEYAEDFNRFNDLLLQEIGTDGTKAVLSLNGSSRATTPGIGFPVWVTP